ncbi:glycosyltransferase [candidate division FCPU426 bacterium]|nr:glycosyltransferase [candidate division FCPU426 bacterium]
MHIGLATDTYLPRVNGVMKSILTFAEQFRLLGHKVTIFAPAFPELKNPEEDVWRFPSLYLFFNPEDRLPNPLALQTRQQLARLHELKLDIIHTQTPFTLGLLMAWRARRLQIPSVHTYHTLFEAYMPHYFPVLPRVMHKPLVAWYSRKFCNLHDQIIVPSWAIKEILSGYGIKKPVKVLPTGTDIRPFQSVDGARMRQQLGFGQDEKMLLCMGRVAGEKNIPFLFDVLKRLEKSQPKARLVVAGQGPALQSVKAEAGARKLGAKVVFLGLLNRRDWADLYAAADLQLLASTTETQGLVLTEAMAAGTPCVAVNALGVQDVLAGGGGLAVPLAVDAFGAAVDRMLSDKDLYSQKVKEAAQQAQVWSAENKAKEMLDTYGGLIHSKHGGRA